MSWRRPKMLKTRSGARPACEDACSTSTALVTCLPIPPASGWREAASGKWQWPGTRYPLSPMPMPTSVGVPTALTGSHGYLEIAVNQGSAASLLKAALGTAISLKQGGLQRSTFERDRIAQALLGLAL